MYVFKSPPVGPVAIKFKVPPVIGTAFVAVTYSKFPELFKLVQPDAGYGVAGREHASTPASESSDAHDSDKLAGTPAPAG